MPRRASGLVLAALVLAASAAGPAHARASGTLAESCTVAEPRFATDATAVLDTDLPAAMPVGASASVTTTASVTFPEAFTSYAYSTLRARSVGGLGQFETDLVGPGLTNVSATIDQAGVPPAGSLVVHLHGTPQTFRATSAGQTVVIGYVYLTALVFTRDDGSTVSMNIACSPTATTPGQDLTIDSVTVGGRRSTTTVVRAAYASRSHRITAKVRVTEAAHTPATGKVRVVLRRGGHKVASATLRLGSAGRGQVRFADVRAAGHYVVTAHFTGNAADKPSTGRRALDL